MKPPLLSATDLSVTFGSGDASVRAVRDMAKQDPAIVAQVVKGWVGRDE